MLDRLDAVVATTITRAIHRCEASGRSAASGFEFEQAIFDNLLEAHNWEHASGPNQFDMNLPITSKTGAHFEYDSVFASDRALYVMDLIRRVRRIALPPPPSQGREPRG